MSFQPPADQTAVASGLQRQTDDRLASARPSFVLIWGDMLQPVHRLAIELLLDCDVGHRRRWRRPVPVLFAWREPDDVTGPNLLDRPTPTLGAAHAGCHDERLAERVGVSHWV